MRSPRYGLVRATRAIGLGEEGTYQNHRGAQATRQFGEVCVSVLKICQLTPAGRCGLDESFGFAPGTETGFTAAGWFESLSSFVRRVGARSRSSVTGSALVKR